MIAAMTIDWSTFGTFALHAVEVLVLILLVLGFVILAAYVLSKAHSTVMAKPTGTLAKAEASPVVKDVETAALKAAEAVLAKVQSAAPITIPNHPAVSAVADVIQESQLAKEALGQIKQGIAAYEQRLNPAAPKS